MSKKSTTESEPMLATEKLAFNPDFGDVLGALMQAGWSYSIEHVRVNESVMRTIVIGNVVGNDGNPHPKAQDVQVVWEYVDGEWFCDRDKTGTVRHTTQGEKITPKTPDQLILHLGRFAPEWIYAEIEAKPTRKPKQKAIGDGKTKHEPEPEVEESSAGLVDEETIEE
jgi:hypothetical protein